METTIYKALELCIWKRIPFVIYIEPDKNEEVFYSAPSLLTSELTERPQKGFFISKFNHKFADNLWIPFELDAAKTYKRRMSMPENKYVDEPIPTQGIDEESYCKKVSQLIQRLEKREKSKTVFSKITPKYMPLLECVNMVDSLFYYSVDCFAYCFYHPQVGFWLGATPEQLLLVDKKKECWSTMSLAGTLPLDVEWDNKNKLEHSYVTQYILKKLIELKMPLDKQEDGELQFGNIKHLCTRLQGKLWGHTPEEIIDKINPTPALCGCPVEDALADIAELEEHDRKCYGGYVGFENEYKLEAYVNIRCANFNKSNFCFYSGGGILPYSDPEEEWLEATSKQLNFERMLIR